jgi:hypothetical protein
MGPQRDKYYSTRSTCQLWVILVQVNGRYIHSLLGFSRLTIKQNPKDKSANKRELKYWIDLAQILERGGINALFLADTYGGYDTYEGSLDNCIRRAAQWPVTDPTIVSSPDTTVSTNEIANRFITAYQCYGSWYDSGIWESIMTDWLNSNKEPCIWNHRQHNF